MTWAVVPDPRVSDVSTGGDPMLQLGGVWLAVVVGALLFAVVVALAIGGRRRG